MPRPPQGLFGLPPSQLEREAHDWYFDPTSGLWLSRTLESVSFTLLRLPPISTAGNTAYASLFTETSVYITDARILYQASATQSGAHYWSMTCYVMNTGGSGIATAFTFNTASGGVGFVTREFTPNVESTTLGTWLLLSVGKVGSPGSIQWVSTHVSFRRIRP